MAGGMDIGGSPGKGKRPLDTSINLVPFIDLMAVTIAFLIMSAVWTQLGRLQVSQSAQAAGEIAEQKNLRPVDVFITEREVRLSFGGQRLDPISIIRDVNSRIDVTMLLARLKEIKQQEPEQNAITVFAEDGVRYEDLVRIIDSCIGASFPAISIAPATG